MSIFDQPDSLIQWHKPMPENPCRKCGQREAIIWCVEEHCMLCAPCWQATPGFDSGTPLARLIASIDLRHFGVCLRVRMMPGRSQFYERFHVEALVPDRDDHHRYTTIVVATDVQAEPGAPEHELLQPVINAVEDIVRHELREQFKVNGIRPLDPHAK